MRYARNATGGMNDVAPRDGALIPDQPADYRAMTKTHRWRSRSEATGSTAEATNSRTFC
jgi:hypothetical protein